MIRFLFALVIALLPNVLKLVFYRRVFRYRIGRNVHIGLSPFYRVHQCTIEDGVRIGHFNLFCDVGELSLGTGCRIGELNLFRGGTRISIGSFASIQRLNVMNSIKDAEVINARCPECEVGAGSVVTSGHWLDFTDRISIGHNVIVGGRSSSFWTHSRQRTRPICIGHHCYLGSEVRAAPGVRIAPLCVAALGSVLMGEYPEEGSMLAGNPAVVQRPLRENDWPLVSRRNREDIPDAIAHRELGPEIVRAANTIEVLLQPVPNRARSHE